MSKHRPDPFVLTNSIANPVLLALLNSRVGAVLGRRLAVIRYDGRRTGQPHQLVTQYRLAGSVVRIPVGAPGRKRWWRNFATPRPAALRLAGRDHLVLAHVVHDRDAVIVTADLRVPLRLDPQQPATSGVHGRGQSHDQDAVREQAAPNGCGP